MDYGLFDSSNSLTL